MIKENGWNVIFFKNKIVEHACFEQTLLEEPRTCSLAHNVRNQYNNIKLNTE